ncbi:MAG TPA: SH3 domain-containing protein, partial [bacterium]|nr:SH3 domain-containing protein [bacterium]
MKNVIRSATGVILLLAGCLLLAGSTETIKRQRAVLREGPGSFFPAVAELSQGTSVEVQEQSNGWYRVTVEEYSGYVSGKAFQGERQTTDVLTRIGQEASVTEVSRSGVSAAVKGFAERFTTRLHGDDSLLETFYSYRIDVDQYRQFRQDTYRNRNLSAIRRRIALPEQDVPDVFSFSEEGIGMAIASKIAGIGLYEDPGLRNYVSNVGYL